MKVLHVISSLDPRAGGPVSALLGLATAQAQCGLEVSVLANDQTPNHEAPNHAVSPVAARLQEQGVRVHLLRPSLGLLRATPTATAILAQTVAAAEVLHIHGLWLALPHAAAQAARRARVPYIFRPCGMLDPWSLAQSRWKKRIFLLVRARRDLNRAASLHFTTPSEADLTAPLHLKAPALIEPNGVDLAEFETLPAPGSFRAHYPQLGARPFVLFLSRVHPKKGLDLLIPAFAAAQLSDAMLIIAGPEEEGYRTCVEALVAKHKLQNRVIFTGMLQGRAKVAAFADADLFVLPSYQENFGNVVVESLAAGTPVVISDQVNIHSQITAAGVGAVVPTETGALAREIQRWMSDEAVRCAAAARARPLVRAHYDWRQIGARWAAHYTRLLESS